MAEYIDREKAIEIIESHMTRVVHSANVGTQTAQVYNMAKNHAIDCLRCVPTEDVVPVVRCRDCKHYDGDFCNHEQWWNDDSYITVDDDDFCSYGERKYQNG